MPLAGPPPRLADRAPRAALSASNDALRVWVPWDPASTDVNTHLRQLEARTGYAAGQETGHGRRPSAHGARYVRQGARGAAPAPRVTGSLTAQCSQIT